MFLLLLHYRPKASGVSDEASTFVETHQVLNKLFEVDLRGVNDASGVLKVRDKNTMESTLDISSRLTSLYRCNWTFWLLYRLVKRVGASSINEEKTR